MNEKKHFFSMIAVALVAAISVGFISCNKDDDKVEPDYSRLLLGKWENGFIDSESHLVTQSMFEFKYNNTYNYKNLNESFEGDYRITENKKKEYLYIWDSYLKVDSLIRYYEIADQIRWEWEIVDGNIVYTDSTFMFGDYWIDYYDSGSFTYSYTYDSTVIVHDTTIYKDAIFFKILASGSNDFDQLEAWYIQSGNNFPSLGLYFYSSKDFLEPKPKWFIQYP